MSESLAITNTSRTSQHPPIPLTSTVVREEVLEVLCQRSIFHYNITYVQSVDNTDLAFTKPASFVIRFSPSMRVLCSTWLNVFHECFGIETTRKSYAMEAFKIIQNHLRPPSIPVMKGLTNSKPMNVIVASSMPKVRLPKPIDTSVLGRMDAPSERPFHSYGI